MIRCLMSGKELVAYLLVKLDFTEKIYLTMQHQFPELKEGDPDLTWEKMWEYYDKLGLNLTKEEEKLFLPYHLLYNLQKKGHNIFYKIPRDYWEQKYPNSP